MYVSNLKCLQHLANFSFERGCTASLYYPLSLTLNVPCFTTVYYGGGAKVLVGRVHKFIQGQPLNLKIIKCILFLHKKPTFSDWPRAIAKQIFFGTGAMHPLLEIDGCKCTRCTRTATAPVLDIHRMFSAVLERRKK